MIVLRVRVVVVGVGVEVRCGSDRLTVHHRRGPKQTLLGWQPELRHSSGALSAIDEHCFLFAVLCCQYLGLVMHSKRRVES